MYNGTAYAYVKSLQGDIVAILDENGNTVVSYGYDAWGAPLWCTGELAETLGKVQPFRYRGYVFDEETGLYYLRSRYYCALISRFLNVDVQVLTAPIQGSNMYVYVQNKQTTMVDTEGKDAIWIQERHSAAGFGHTGLMVQNSEGDWYYFFWGPESENVEKELITGTTTECYLERVDTHGIILTDKESVVAALKGSSDTAPEAVKRAELITDVYYFEGDYTATYERANALIEDHQKYSLLGNNCLQNTVDALHASDWRFSLVVYGELNGIIPNDAAAKASMMPRKKEEFPWGLFLSAIVESW